MKEAILSLADSCRARPPVPWRRKYRLKKPLKQPPFEPELKIVVEKAPATGIPCFVLSGLSDTLFSDHAKDTVLLLFPSDDVLRPASWVDRELRPEPAQTGLEFGQNWQLRVSRH